MQIRPILTTPIWMTPFFLALLIVHVSEHVLADDGRQTSGNGDILITRLDEAVDAKFIQKTVDPGGPMEGTPLR